MGKSLQTLNQTSLSSFIFIIYAAKFVNYWTSFKRLCPAFGVKMFMNLGIVSISSTILNYFAKLNQIFEFPLFNLTDKEFSVSSDDATTK